MTNPLARHFRQPAIYLNLPSDGKFYPPTAIEMPVNRELPVFPMTALDEITYRTPDALFNGSAIVEVIRSCIPNIKDPWQIPATDLDSILVAIRIASYGHEMEFASDCPHCSHENEFVLDLRLILDQLKSPDFTQPVKLGDMEVYLRPLSYQQINENSRKQFEEQRVIQSVPDSNMTDEEKLARLRDALAKLTHLTIDALADSISEIRVDDTVVSNPEHILEFVTNADRQKYNIIRDRIVQLRKDAETKPLVIKCQNPECGKEYETPFTLDVANFFD